VTLFRLTILCAILFAGGASADNESPLRAGGSPASIRLAGTDEANDVSKVYIVQLRTPAAAQFHTTSTASTRTVAKTSPGQLASVTPFDKSSAAVQSHVEKIVQEQASVITRAGPAVEQIHSYQYALNGFAARMTPQQANKVEHMPEVLRIWEDEVRPLTTNFSADFLDLFATNTGLRGAPGLDGDGIVIGVIDSGIAPEHPALQDTREADRPRLCRSSWAEASLLGLWLCRRYDSLEDVEVFGPPENWNGVCQTGPQFTEEDCNNKLIGARFIVDGANATGPIDADEIFSPRDVDSHGTHTATTAAGNRVKASIFGTFLGRVEGMAPKARIAVYKACWLRPDATRASCNTSDLANAIDLAVADGVHIINYSVGSSLFTVTAPDDIALLAAAKAGVLTVVAAGNEGPNFDTITSPAGNPAVITAAASSRTGEHSLEAMQVSSPPAVAGKYAVKEAAFTPALLDRDPIEGQLVLVDDDDDTLPDGTSGISFDACQSLVNGSELSGNIAFIQRGGCDFDVKVANAADAGAIAVVVFNITGAPIVMTGVAGLSDIPALMIGAADGNLILDEINADQVIDVVLDKSFFLTETDTGNIMGSFSSRGPGPVPDIFKPDLTAPGINILAGSTPDAANSVAGEFFAFLTGTSMAAPHISGVAALLKQGHPDWSPAAIKSALMTTAHQNVNLSDGTTPAIPFDFGSGHIDPNKANDPGLVYDVTDDDYDAFSCGVGSPDVDQARCDALVANGFSLEPADLNQPSISVSRLITTRTVSRRVTNVSDAAETYSAEIVLPPGIDVQVSPSSLTLGAGETASYDVTLNYLSGPLDIYRFGSLTWVSDDHSVRSVLSVQPLSISAPGEVFSFGGSGSVTFPVDFGYTGSYSPGVHGLNLPLVLDGFVDEDPNKSFSFRTTNGVTAHLIDVPADQAFMRFAMFDELTDGDDDLDMFVYYCPDGINCSKIGQSGEATSREQVDILLPGAGTYAVLIHGFATDNVAGGPGSSYTLLGWSFGLMDNQGNMSATGPTFVTAGTTQDVTIDWNGLAPDTIYLGGISHNTPDGLVSITVINIGN
jgi:subtilisin family serine protease